MPCRVCHAAAGDGGAEQPSHEAPAAAVAAATGGGSTKRRNEVFGSVTRAAKAADSEVGKVFDSLPANTLVIVASGVGDAAAVRR